MIIRLKSNIMKNRLFYFLSFLFLSQFSIAQKNSNWIEVQKPVFNSAEKIRRSSLPSDYKLFQFDYQNFVRQLNDVPKRDDFRGVSSVIVAIPNAKGELIDYRIVEASSFEDKLQVQFPSIRSFAGNAVNDGGTVIRFSISPSNGLSALTRTSTGETHIIDPYSMDYKTLIVFDKAKSKRPEGHFICTTEEAVQQFGQHIEMDNFETLRNADDGFLRKFRMAQSCTAEYSNYFGATTSAQVNLVLAAFNATYTRCNAIFEMDFNCTMQLIANTTDVIYYNAATDPYSSVANIGNWNNQLGTTLQNVIGNSNYDIGHLFGASGGGGNAGCIGCVCSSDNAKGRAYTSPSNGMPEGDFFDIDYVAHEIGHQLGGNHTFSHGNENNSVNMEPGSGITIMGYAGITGATDVAAHSIPIFHAGTIEQITNNIKVKSCPVKIATGNAIPIVSVPSSKTLPIGTAFKLTGTATDADAGDVLSYCWEQVDDATTVGPAASYPSVSKTNGPNFRSFMPKNNGTRNFPRLEDHVANGVAGNQWEIIPNIVSANRTLNFRMTVRDNRGGGATNKSGNTAVTFDKSYGPFLVTSQNMADISYTQGSTQTVTWSVNNTTALPGSTNVNIKLSTDGGQTYDITLVANTPNDGSQSITIPNVSSPFCRILIEPTGNDYYAINTKDFAIGYSVTTTTTCNQYSFTPNLVIPDGLAGGGYGAVTGFIADIPVTSGVISDINILNLNVSHTYINDVVLALNHPDDTQLLYVNRVCGNQNGFKNTNLDSQATANIPCTGNSDSQIGAGPYKPSSSFDVFNGKSASGIWQFLAVDGYLEDTGTLNSLVFEICTASTIITEAPNACGVITTTWNGSAWSNGVPLKNVTAIFAGNYTANSNLEACSVVINSGSNVVFNAGHTLIVGNEVTVNGTGSLTINNNAALRQINGAATNTGNIIVKKESAPMIRQDYTAWASPVAAQQLQSFSPNTLPNRFYEYLYTGTTTLTAYQAVSAATNFITGKGYIIRAADNSSASVPAVHSGQFTGVPFNGNLTMTLGKGYNLLGNPYASPIDADRFLLDNTSTVGALYFWTHTVPASGGVYPVNNFAAYTTLGGTASAAGGAIPNGTIQTGQGFYVKALEFGTANFSNLQRVNAATSTQFFRTNATPDVEVEKHRIWLNLNDANNSYNQLLLGYMNGATNDFDNQIDGKVLDDSKPILFNIIAAEKYIIQGRSLPFTDADIVPLGLKVLTAGTYTISMENFDGLFVNQDVFLKDKYNNIIHNIKQTPYVFTAQEGIVTNRFEIVYKNTLATDEFLNESNITVYSSSNGIVISATENIDEIIIFDVLGRKLYHNNKVNDKEIIVSKVAATNQALLVQIRLTNKLTTTKKVIF